MPNTPPETAIALLLERAGFTLSPTQIAEYAEAYGYITEMASRIRVDRSYMDEPAHLFSFPAEAAPKDASQ